MHNFIDLALRTKSDNFFGERISLEVFKSYLEQFVQLGTDLDQIKKTLFYGKEPHMFSARQDPADAPVPEDVVKPDVIHGVLGVMTEAAEMADALLQAFNGRGLDEHNLHEESGDVKWYLALLAKSREETWDADEKTVIYKLQLRYPNAFTEHDAEVRNLDAERQIIEDRGSE